MYTCWHFYRCFSICFFVEGSYSQYEAEKSKKEQESIEKFQNLLSSLWFHNLTWDRKKYIFITWGGASFFFDIDTSMRVFRTDPELRQTLVPDLTIVWIGKDETIMRQEIADFIQCIELTTEQWLFITSVDGTHTVLNIGAAYDIIMKNRYTEKKTKNITQIETQIRAFRSSLFVDNDHFSTIVLKLQNAWYIQQEQVPKVVPSFWNQDISFTSQAYFTREWVEIWVWNGRSGNTVILLKPHNFHPYFWSYDAIVDDSDYWAYLRPAISSR